MGCSSRQGQGAAPCRGMRTPGALPAKAQCKLTTSRKRTRTYQTSLIELSEALSCAAGPSCGCGKSLGSSVRWADIPVDTAATPTGATCCLIAQRKALTTPLNSTAALKNQERALTDLKAVASGVTERVAQPLVESLCSCPSIISVFGRQRRGVLALPRKTGEDNQQSSPEGCGSAT